MRSRDRVTLPGSDREPVASASSPSPIDNHELAQVTVVLRKRPQTQPAEAEEFGFQDSQEVNYHTREEFAVMHGATFAGSHRSKPSSGAFTTSPRPGVASVKRVRAAGAIEFERTPYRLSSLAQTCENVAIPDLAES